MGESDGEVPSDMPSVVKAIRAGEVHMPTSSEVLQEFPWALPCLIVALVVAFLLLAGCLVYCLRLSPAARERRELARAVKKSYAPAPGGFAIDDDDEGLGAAVEMGEWREAEGEGDEDQLALRRARRASALDQDEEKSASYDPDTEDAYL